MTTRQQAADVLKDLQEIEDKIREAAQKEYAHDEENAFGNFERIAAVLKCKKCGEHFSRDQILMVYLLKHIDGIVAYVNGHKTQREDIEGRIIDARVYEALLAAMFREDKDLPF